MVRPEAGTKETLTCVAPGPLASDCILWNLPGTVARDSPYVTSPERSMGENRGKQDEAKKRSLTGQPGHRQERSR
jgi:hypothetical protein